jgi:hypothetical protein
MKKHLYPLKGYTNVFVSLDGEIPVEERDGKKIGRLSVFEIRDSRTNSGSPLQTMKMSIRSFFMDTLTDAIDVSNPQMVSLPAVQEY